MAVTDAFTTGRVSEDGRIGFAEIRMTVSMNQDGMFSVEYRTVAADGHPAGRGRWLPTLILSLVFSSSGRPSIPALCWMAPLPRW